MEDSLFISRIILLIPPNIRLKLLLNSHDWEKTKIKWHFLHSWVLWFENLFCIYVSIFLGNLTYAFEIISRYLSTRNKNHFLIIILFCLAFTSYNNYIHNPPIKIVHDKKLSLSSGLLLSHLRVFMCFIHLSISVVIIIIIIINVV